MENTSPRKVWMGKLALPASLCLLLLILSLPMPGLSSAGQIVLAILAMAVLLWITEALAYPISALLIVGLMTLLLGLVPDSETGAVLGTNKAIGLAMKGFSSTGIVMISGALVMAAAMQATGLDRRIALAILSRVRPDTSAILAGCLSIGVVLAFLIPSPTGRTAVQVPILTGVISTLGLSDKSRLAAILMIGAAQVSTVWNVGIMTASVHNVAGLELMAEHSGFSITWGRWLLYAAPWSLLMTIILFFILRRAISGHDLNGHHGDTTLYQAQPEWEPAQKRLATYTGLLLMLWIMEGIVHHVSVPASMLSMSVCLLLPGIGVFEGWKDVEKRLPWGVIVMFGVSISLGQQLVSTGAAGWLAEVFFSSLDLQSMSLVLLILVMTLFTTILHLGFASAMSLTVTLIPIFLALADSLPESMKVNGASLVLLQLFAISFGMILPVNAPQNMLAYSTGSFDTKTFARIGIQLTAASLMLFVLFAMSWWRWIGLLS
ncbi:SLC13 family permease [Sansalvadorimonas verongulae]|uniref:SLC13 family permease n=1 Tax=Sansalvadorimonas verongulae TaxID=2172824 RepID=UPI0018AD11E0|nr:SLC13 family permease [Sansalvadorimonas verongulae]